MDNKTWLVISYVKTISEIIVLHKDLYRCKKILNNTTDVYWIDVRTKYITVYYICNNYIQNIYKTHDGTLVYFIDILHKIKNTIKIDGVLYYGHGYGYGISLFNMNITDFIDIVVKSVQPIVICFDACYMGDIILLYEIAPFIRFIIANSSYHPWNSITSLKAFGQFSDFTFDNMPKYILEMITEYNISVPKKYKSISCLVGYDTQYIDYIKNITSLDFHEQKHLPYDKYRYNLLDGIKDDDLKNQLYKILIVSKNNCLEECNGISISLIYDVKHKGLNIYNTRWYKEIHNNIFINVKQDKNIKYCKCNIYDSKKICNL